MILISWLMADKKTKTVKLRDLSSADLKRQARRIEVETAGARAAKRLEALRLRGIVRYSGLL